MNTFTNKSVLVHTTLMETKYNWSCQYQAFSSCYWCKGQLKSTV